jgi:hypothetical protein
MRMEKVMKVEEIKFKDLVKELPCISCIVRPFCFHFGDSNSSNKISDPCDKVCQWMDKEKQFRKIIDFNSRDKILHEVLKIK